MKILYFDCFAGAAGDMILGALVDLGVPFDELRRALGSLAVDGYTIAADRVMKQGLSSMKFRVHEHAAVAAGGATSGGQPPADGPVPHRHYHLKHIRAAIDRSALSDAGKARANGMFTRLAEAEAAVHGTSLEKVHLHEVGAIDSIIDIVGAVFAFEWLGVDRVVVSPMNVGGGMVRSAHGVFPVPAPATVRLLGAAPVYSSGVQLETLTPTGALVLTEYAAAYGPMPAMRVTAVGYGAGDRELPETPNVLRAVLGEASASASAMRVSVMACEIDDMNPQIFGVLMDRLLEAGALEVYYQPVQMKKNRPGTLMTVVSRPEDRERLADLVFAETTTIGVRYQTMDRDCLDRETVSVATPLGDVRVKVARRAGRLLNAQPEFDDVARLAAAHGVPVKDVHAQATKAWLDRQS
ncbi:MAG: nickel pincer cofactor biosynthesis protein LarC [Vicinamibacterales bacterium]